MSLSAARCPAQSVILSFKGRNLVEVKKVLIYVKIVPKLSQPKRTRWCFKRVWLLKAMLGDEVWALAD